MLTDISKKQYRKHFPSDPHPYISDGFLGLVENKAERMLRLVEANGDVLLGIIAGVKDNGVYSPFSAPFGGFHYSHEELFYADIFSFLIHLQEFIVEQKFNQITITLPPNVYQHCIHAKLVNAFIRVGFKMDTPEIGNWANLKDFNGTWAKNRVDQNCRKAIKNNLTFSHATNEESMREAFDIILENRARQERAIHMTFSDLLEVNKVIPVDFFLVKKGEKDNVGAGVFYRGHEKIIQGIFMGDDLENRALGTMNFMMMNLYNFYKNRHYEFIDFGRSSENGMPSEGLIRFKEIHNCVSSLRYTFSWSPDE